MSTTDGRGGRRGGLVLLALVAAVAGVAVLVVALLGRESEPPRLDGPVGDLGSETPSTAPASPRASATPRPSTPDVASATEVPLAASVPTSIEIPALDVRSDLLRLGLADDGTLEVPQPGPDLDKAAWFENSPTPGQVGPAIIEGHVSTDENGPSIFYDLAELRPGDAIRVARKDGTVAEFEVEALREFAKSDFPTELIYGGDVASPTLRLITCSNFDPSVGNHTGNLVVFSRLTGVVAG